MEVGSKMSRKCGEVKWLRNVDQTTGVVEWSDQLLPGCDSVKAQLPLR
jgi:hypothetical protein